MASFMPVIVGPIIVPVVEIDDTDSKDVGDNVIMLFAIVVEKSWESVGSPYHLKDLLPPIENSVSPYPSCQFWKVSTNALLPNVA